MDYKGSLKTGVLFRAAILLLMVPLLSVAAPAGWQPLLEPDELAAIIQVSPEVRVIQVTGNYTRGHVPGSVESPYADWRGSGRNPGELRDLADYTTLLQKLGITGSTPVAVIHEGSNPADMGAATRVYWTLKSLGVADVAVVNGGLEAWQQADLPLSTEIGTVSASNYEPAWREDWRITTSQLEELVQEGSGNLIDARPVSFYRGLRATLGDPGTIRGAGNIQYESWFEGDRLAPRESLAGVMKQYEAQDGALDSPVTVSFCNTGHWASINWFVMSELLQVNNARLYAESVAGWSEQDRPMDNQAGRLRVYRDQTASWLRDLLGN